MTLRYLFGPVTPQFTREHLPAPGHPREFLTFSATGSSDLLLTEEDTWESLCQKFPEGWRPDFIALYLTYATIPSWLWTAPVPIIGLAADFNLQWHWYRQILGCLDLVFTDSLAVDLLSKEGISWCLPANLYGLRQSFLEFPWPDGPRDIDLLFVGFLNQAIHRKRLPWLARLAQLGQRHKVVIEQGVYGDDYCQLLSRAKIVFNYTLKGECNCRVWEAVAAGALLFVEESNREVPSLLADKKGCIFFNEQNLEELVDYYLEQEAERKQITQAARAKLASHTFSALWQEMISRIEQHWPKLVKRSQERRDLLRPQQLLTRTWQALGTNEFADPTLARNLAAEVGEGTRSANWHNALGLITARQGQDQGRITSLALKQATGCFQRAVVADPGHPLARLNLAEALFLENRVKEAVEQTRAAQAVLDEEDTDPLAWEAGHFPLGFDLFRVEWERAAWENAGNPQKEIQAKKALLHWRGHTLLGELTGKLEHFYEAALARPDLFTAQAALGCALARAGQVELAIAHLSKAVNANPFDPAATWALFELYKSAGKKRPQHLLAYQQRLLHRAAPKLVPKELWFALQLPQKDGLASIIILCCNQLDYTRQCLESLLQKTRLPYELILIDNGSTDGTLTYLEQIKRRKGPERVKIIRNEKNLGFAKGCNQGLTVADGEFLVLLNNDTILTTGWLEGLIRWSLHDWPKNGLIGAVTNYAAPPQEIPVSYRTPEEMEAFAQRHCQEFAGQAIETERLVGFCVLLRRDVLEEIGNLDTRFGLGFFEDDDWGVRARKAGYRLLVAQEVFIHHFGSRTFSGLGIDAYQQLQDNFALFEQKWGKECTEGYRLPEKLSSAASSSLVASKMEPETRLPNPEEAIPIKSAKPRLSLCMMAKNEEERLPACLTSVADVVDEIVIVVDSGSTDRTKEIAQQFGAKVVDFTWVDSFAAARNASLLHATGEWIFWMDADEILDEENRQKFRQLVANLPQANMAFIMRQSSPLEGAAHAAVYVDQVRLFRHHPNLRWQYRVHEQILPSLRGLGAEVSPTDIVIHHTGFAQAAEQGAKVNRNLRLLERELAENPGDPFVLYNLGAVYLTQGQLEEALRYLKQSLDHSQPGDTLIPKLLGLLIRCHHQKGERTSALEVCQRARQLCPEDGELLFWQAILSREGGELAACEECLLDILRLPARIHFASADAGLYGYRTRGFLGEIYRDQGRVAEAEAQWLKAVMECPEFSPGWHHLGQLWLEQGRWQELERAVKHLDRDPQFQAEAALLQGRSLLARREFASARILTEEGLAEHPNWLPLRILLSHVLLQQGENWEAAEKALLAILELQPDQAEARHNLQLLRQQRKGSTPVSQALSEGPTKGTPARTGRQRITLTMMVKNEEENLPACLESVADLVDEMVIIDTGSTDRTKEIAQQFGAKVVDFTWVDSFSAARNEGLRHATGDWIFWMDADDRLDEENRDQLRRLFGQLDDQSAGFLMKCLCLPDPVTQIATQVDHVRLFRHLPGLNWRFRVHEQILPALREADAEIRWSDIVIHHTGYQDPELRGRKLQRDLRLLQLEMQEQPENPFTLFNLGSVYREQGKLEEAIPLFRRSLDNSKPSDSIVRKLYVLLAQCHRQLGRAEEALRIVHEGRHHYPTDIELLFQQGVALNELKDVWGAITSWEAVLSTDPGKHLASVDVGLRGYLTHHNLAVAYEKVGRPHQAEAHWQAALAEKPDYEPALLGVAEAHLRQRRFADLERLLEKLKELPSMKMDASVLRARIAMADHHFDQAREVLEETIAEFPQTIWPRVVLTHLLLQQGKDWAAAEQALRQVLALEPNHAEAKRNLELLLKQLGKENPAVCAGLERGEPALGAGGRGGGVWSSAGG